MTLKTYGDLAEAVARFVLLCYESRQSMLDVRSQMGKENFRSCLRAARGWSMILPESEDLMAAGKWPPEEYDKMRTRGEKPPCDP